MVFPQKSAQPSSPMGRLRIKNIFFQRQFSLLYWAKLSIIVIYSLIPYVKTKLMSEEGERGNYILLKKTKVSTKINNLTSINILLTQNPTKTTRRSKLVTCLRQSTLSVWCQHVNNLLVTYYYSNFETFLVLLCIINSFFIPQMFETTRSRNHI
jgi:hypothetical protein